MSVPNGSPPPPESTSSVRAEPRSMYDACSGIDGAASSARNPAESRSSRAEQTTAPHPALSIGGRARRVAADLFHGVLTERWERGDDSVSNRVLADRYLEVDEKLVRQYRDGRKHVPLAALVVLPVPVVRDIVDRLMTLRGVSEREDAATLRQTIRRLRERQPRDRAELLRVAKDARDELIALVDQLSEAK